MSEDRMIAIVGIVMVLVLIGTGLQHRRLGQRRWLQLSVLWLLIFLGAWAAATLGIRIAQHHFT